MMQSRSSSNARSFFHFDTLTARRSDKFSRNFRGFDPYLRQAPEALPEVDSLDLRDAKITTVIWATGYRYDFGWIDCPVFDKQGQPEQRRGVTGLPGLYFLGLPRLHKLKSSFLWGVGEDAEYLANHMAAEAPHSS